MTSEERAMMAETRQAVADGQADAAYAGSYLGLKDQLARAKCLNTDNDPVFAAQTATRIASLEARIAAMDAAETARVLATWDRETTITRRATFNAAVKALGKTANARTVATVERTLGYSRYDLGEAIAAHGL